jgi:hypothetical protein
MSTRIRSSRTQADKVHVFFILEINDEDLHGVLDGFAGSCGGQEVVDGHLLVLVLLVWKNRFGQETTQVKGASNKHHANLASTEQSEAAKRTVFEEAADLLEAVRRELADVVVVAVLGIVGADGDDLVVLLPLFQHFFLVKGRCQLLQLEIELCCKEIIHPSICVPDLSWA